MDTEMPSYTRHPVEFTGNNAEYFKIWIVNILLSIVTLGIYSAWAKVRTNQYFHGHTKLNGHSFRYLAKPLQILKGRLLAFLVFVIFSIVSSVSPAFTAVFLLALFFAMPWIFVQAMNFNMRMTSYRNVRFSFEGTYGDAFKYLILGPILGPLTLYLAMPWVLKKIDMFTMGNITYGGKRLDVEPSTGRYYLAALVTIGTAALLYLVVIVVGVVFGFSLASLSPGSMSGAPATPGVGIYVSLLLFMVAFWLGSALVGSIYKSLIRNHLLSVAEIEDVAKFESNMRPLSYAVLQFTNGLIVLFTLGFGYPVAKIRHAAYMAQATAVLASVEAENIVDNLAESGGAFGEEAAGFFDLDVSLT